MELAIRSFLVYALGDISGRFGSAEAKRVFLCYVLYFLATYTLTFESCPNIEIGGDGISSSAAWVLITPCFVIAAYCFARNCQTACNRPPMAKALFFGSVSVLLAIHWVMVFFGSTAIRIHLHHHHWAFALSIICRAPDRVSQCVQAMLIAIFVHGLSVFGCENLFQWELAEEAHFQQMCREWTCPVWKCILPKH